MTSSKEGEQTSLVNYERHFNNDLADDSEYFGALRRMTECVEKHANEHLTDLEKDKVCAREFKSLRIAAF